jgi:hypothetical protein
MTSLGLLLAALAIAVLTVHRVLRAWAAEWSQSRELYTFYLLKQLKHFEPEQVGQEKEDEHVNRLVKATEVSRGYAGPKGYNQWVLWHVGFLLAGLLSYILARWVG